MCKIEQEKISAAKESMKFVSSGMVVGLGSGSTAAFVVKFLAEKVKCEDVDVICVATSSTTAKLATSLGLSLIDQSKISNIDITIDGADEFDASLNLVKGGGGALLKEKVVARASSQFIIVADSRKQVLHLGSFPLPVEVIPFAVNAVSNELSGMKGQPKMRQSNGKPFISEEGNNILDVDFGQIVKPNSLSDDLDSIPGIVEHGLFCGYADRIIMGVCDPVVVF